MYESVVLILGDICQCVHRDIVTYAIFILDPRAPLHMYESVVLILGDISMSIDTL